jgi:hypothetical protein
MYNTTIVCTYNTPEIFIETDNIVEEDKTFIRNVIYRQELLNIFGMEDYNDDTMKTAFNELYEKVKDCEELKECMLKIDAVFMYGDKEMCFITLFSYDYMYLTHICISEFLESGKITEINKNNLIDIIL